MLMLLQSTSHTEQGSEHPVRFSFLSLINLGHEPGEPAWFEAAEATKYGRVDLKFDIFRCQPGHHLAVSPVVIHLQKQELEHDVGQVPVER